MDRESILRLGEAYNQVVNEDWRDLLKGTPLGRPYTDKEKEAIRQGLKTTNDKTIDKQGIERALSTDSAMTQGQEDSRTNIPRTDAQGNRIYTDADRPQGYHTIKKDGKDIRRYWDAKNKNWRVDPDNQFQMGVEKPNDPAARQIRQDSVPGPKVFDMKTDENPLETLRDQGGKMFDAIRGVGPGPKDIKGLDDPLDLGGATGLKPQGSGTKDKVDQQRADGIGGLPSDYKGTEAQQFQAADKFRQGAGTSALPAGVRTQVKGAAAKQDAVDAQKGGGSSNLTPMQQWAKNFPKLAAKVKPGQAGYDDIQKMNQPSSAPATQQQTQNASKLGSTPQRTQQAFSNQNQGLNKVSQPIARSMSRVSDASSKMNNVKQSNSKLAFKGLPESYTPDDIVMDFLMEGLNHDEQSARALIPHLSPEFRAYIEENWAQDWARKAGSFMNNAGRAISRGTQGKKVDKDSNPVHRALNSITRGTGDTAKAFGSGLTQKSDSPDSATNDQKDNDEKKDTPKKDTPKVATPPKVKTPPKKDSKSTGSDDKVGGRLGSALKWASDPKNKDAWMKEALADLMGELLDEGRGLAAGKDDYDKMRERNANAGHTPGNTYATAQRRMRSDMKRGEKKQPGVKVPKPAHLTPAQELQHRTGMTKARLAQKHSGTAAGRRQIANNAMDAAELGGSKNNRGS